MTCSQPESSGNVMKIAAESLMCHLGRNGGTATLLRGSSHHQWQSTTHGTIDSRLFDHQFGGWGLLLSKETIIKFDASFVYTFCWFQKPLDSMVLTDLKFSTSFSLQKKSLSCFRRRN